MSDTTKENLKEIRDRTTIDQALFQNIFMVLIDNQINKDPKLIPENVDYKGLENKYKTLAIKLTNEVINVLKNYQERN